MFDYIFFYGILFMAASTFGLLVSGKSFAKQEVSGVSKKL